jgi:hypothetical protein
VSDFFTELRREVVNAHGRESLRRRRWRVPALRPGAAFATALAVAGAVGLFVVVSVLVRSSPQVAHPHIVKVVHIDRDAADATFAAGSVWVSSDSGNITRVDPVSRRVIAKIPVSGGPGALSGDANGVWSSGGETQLIRIDVRTNRIADHFRRSALNPVVSGGAVWYTAHTGGTGLRRLDPVSRRITARLSFDPTTLAAAGDALWGQTSDGTIAEIDAVSGRIVRRFPGVAPMGGGSDQANGLVADDTGVWASSYNTGQLVRVGATGVVERIDVGIQPTAVAQFDDAVWVVTGDGLRGGFWVSRVDPGSGRVVARVGLGAVQPTALVSTGRELWAICFDGTARVIRPR